MLELPWPVIDTEEALREIDHDPNSGYPLRGRLRGLHSLLVGSFRIIYTFRVAATRHRVNAHRRDPR